MPRKTTFAPDVLYKRHIKGKDDRPAPIYAVIQRGLVYKCYPGMVATKAEWSEKTRSYKLPSQDNAERRKMMKANDRLKRFQQTMLEVWEKHWFPGMPTAEFSRLVYIADGRIVDPKIEKEGLMDFVNRYVKERWNAKGSVNGTVKNLNTWRTHLAAYMHRFGELGFDDINLAFVPKFVDWLYTDEEFEMPHLEWSRATGDYVHNPKFIYKKEPVAIQYAAKGLSVIKQFINAARDADLTTNDKVLSSKFHIGSEGTNKHCLYVEDLNDLAKVDLSQNERLNNTRLLLFVGCFTGLRFSDWGKFQERFIKDVDGEKFIEVRAQKTKDMVAIPFLPVFEKLLTAANWSIRGIAPSNFNLYVKELLEYCKLDRTIIHIETKGGVFRETEERICDVFSSHGCRRTFVTMMLEVGVEPIRVMAITGHTTEKMLFEYANMRGRMNAGKMAKSFRQKNMEFLMGK